MQRHRRKAWARLEVAGVGFLDRFRKPNPFATPAGRDKLSLQYLEKRGAVLALPRHVIHFLYFDTEADAEHAREEIPEAEWDATVVAPNEPGKQWIVRAEGIRVVDSQTVASYRAWFERVAERCNGEYDGWEAANTP
jgi:hypothetical protein